MSQSENQKWRNLLHVACGLNQLTSQYELDKTDVKYYFDIHSGSEFCQVWQKK